ncbi:MAG: hypothetical protein RQ756_05955, partial [Flavobacteriaceae bacterium]|nr:hypothetical protein [Flavobacteriaceae bacterium]
QRYTTSYTFNLISNESFLNFDQLKNRLSSHQLNFVHKINAFWLADFKTEWNQNRNTSQNFENRNFELEGFNTIPKLSYFFNSDLRFDLIYEFSTRNNQIGDREQLNTQRFGTAFFWNNVEKWTINADFNYIEHDFEGNSFSPVSYQMMQGLSPGTNLTWSLVAQRKITSFIDLNLNYFGRKTQNSQTIHTGTIQLKAYF